MAFGVSRRQAFLDAAAPSSEDDRDDDLFAKLAKLAEVLASPASIKKALGDLAAATKAHEERDNVEPLFRKFRVGRRYDHIFAMGVGKKLPGES